MFGFSTDIPLHPSLVHFPIALLLTGAAAAILFRLWGRPAGEQWGVYALLAGWVLVIPALITGLIDKNALPPDSPENQLANIHTTGMFLMWGLYGLALYLQHIWRKQAALGGGRLWVWLGLLVAASVTLILAGHQGGRLVYELGVGVMGS
jgi:uncharacterized membrane protein